MKLQNLTFLIPASIIIAIIAVIVIIDRTKSSSVTTEDSNTTVIETASQPSYTESYVTEQPINKENAETTQPANTESEVTTPSNPTVQEPTIDELLESSITDEIENVDNQMSCVNGTEGVSDAGVLDFCSIGYYELCKRYTSSKDKTELNRLKKRILDKQKKTFPKLRSAMAKTYQSNWGDALGMSIRVSGRDLIVKGDYLLRDPDGIGNFFALKMDDLTALRFRNIIFKDDAGVIIDKWPIPGTVDDSYLKKQ